MQTPQPNGVANEGDELGNTGSFTQELDVADAHAAEAYSRSTVFLFTGEVMPRTADDAKRKFGASDTTPTGSGGGNRVWKPGTGSGQKSLLPMEINAAAALKPNHPSFPSTIFTGTGQGTDEGSGLAFTAGSSVTGSPRIAFSSSVSTATGLSTPSAAAPTNPPPESKFAIVYGRSLGSAALTHRTTWRASDHHLIAPPP